MTKAIKSTRNRIIFVDPSILYSIADDGGIGGPPNSTSACAGSDYDGFRRAARYAAMLFYLVCIIAARRSRRNHNVGMTYACLFYRIQGLPGSVIALRDAMNRKTVIRRSNNLRAWLDPSGYSDIVAGAEESVDAHEAMLSTGDRSSVVLRDFTASLAHVSAEWARRGRDALRDFAALVNPTCSVRSCRLTGLAHGQSHPMDSHALYHRLSSLLGDPRAVDFVISVLRDMATSRRGEWT